MKVSPIKLMKTHVEKMSETGHAIISVKTKHLKASRHYMHENKGSYGIEDTCGKRSSCGGTAATRIDRGLLSRSCPEYAGHIAAAMECKSFIDARSPLQADREVAGRLPHEASIIGRGTMSAVCGRGLS
jgi:hypothetical protein